MKFKLILTAVLIVLASACVVPATPTALPTTSTTPKPNTALPVLAVVNGTLIDGTGADH